MDKNGFKQYIKFTRSGLYSSQLKTAGMYKS